MTELVIDASVAIKWFVAEPDSALAVKLFERVGGLAAPRLLMVEIASGLRKNFVRRLIRRETVLASIRAVESLIEAWHEDESLLIEALTLALDLDHPIYDCFYLALARKLNTVCVTADIKLLNKVAGTPFAPLAVGLADWRAA